MKYRYAGKYSKNPGTNDDLYQMPEVVRQMMDYHPPIFLKDGKGSHICEYLCAGIHITDKVTRWRKENAVRYLVLRTPEGHTVHVRMDELGKTIFVERVEAERRLRNGKSNKHKRNI